MSAISALRDVTRQSFLKESAYFRLSSPIFSALTRASVADEEIVDLCSVTRRGQSAGQLLMCVVHYLVLRSPGSKLAAHYPTVTAAPTPVEDAFPAFREFCLDRREEVQDLLSRRTANTNLVEKASSVLPAMQYVDGLSDEPLTLLEICCSSGMNMLFDEYHYDYGVAGSVGSSESPVQLQCKLVGARRLPIDSMPLIAHRIGVDLVKMDTASELERLWMEAVLCPEWLRERDRLRAALSLRMARDLNVVEGDALDVLPSLLETLPGAVCILQSYCMGHWSPGAKLELEELLRKASVQREIHRVAIEMPDSELPHVTRQRLIKLAAAGVPILGKSFPSRIEHTWYTKGDAKTHLLGQGDGFGVWLDWGIES